MATTPRSTANVSREVNDRNKGYTRVVFQQGVPVFDVDLTTAQVLASEQNTNATHASEGYADMGSFGQAGAFVPLHATPTNVRNTQNYGIVKGVINTRLGPVDMLRGGISKPVLPFSHYNLVATSSALTEDGDYDNYVLRGVTTAGTANNTVQDDSKSFGDVHGLVAQSVEIDVTWASGAIDDDGDGAASSTTVTLGDPGCAVVLLDGANAGLVRAVVAITGPAKLQVAPFPNTVAAGTSYAIVPLNVFQLGAFVSALAGVALAEEPPILISALQAFEEDICAYEDTTLEHPARAGQDVSHRNQLRWCVRTLYVLTDNPIDQLGSASAFSALLRNRQPLFAAANDVNAKARDAVRHDSNGLRLSNTLPEPYWPQIRTAKVAPHRSLMQLFGMFAEAEFFGGEAAVVPLFLLRGAPRARTQYGTSLHPGYVGTATLQPLFCLRPKDLPDGNRPSRPSIFVQRESTRLSSGQTSSILTQMAGLGVPPSTYDAGLFYDSNGRELAFDNAARAAQHTQRLAIAALGVGQDWGTQDDGTSTAGLVGLPTSPLLISDGREEGEIAFAGAGQPSTESLPDLTGVMSNNASIPGVLVPIALVDGSGFNVPDVFDTGVDLRFSAGVGLSSYFLRNGTEITIDGPNGWSFFTADAQEDGVDIRRVREPHEGIVQAARMQESLLWRQLAIKSTAHESADLFTYYVPNVPTVIDSFEEPLRANQYSVAAVGALQTSLTTETDYQDGLSWDQRESYTLGGSRLLGAGPTSVVSYGQLTRLGDAETASEGVDFDPALHPKDPELRGAFSLEAATSFDTDNPDSIDKYGAWGRGTATKVQAGLISTSTLDQRCTSMRLRYHIGDYYPAPDGSNALVTSLMLYTRFEQLSLVHWATMPKHQHPVLAKSLSSYAGVISALTGLVVKGDDTHLVDGDGAPLMQEESPQGSEEPGDIDWTTLPFGHEHQPFVHWYHPMQEYITSPHPGGIDFNDATPRKIAYSKFGERSLIIPSMVMPYSSAPNANVEGADNWGFENPASAGDVLGGHFNVNEPTILPDTPGQPTGILITLADSTTVLVKSTGVYFPFNPLDDERTTGTETIRQEGIPGPVFMPAGRQYAYGDDWNGTGRDFGFHPVFNAVDAELSSEWSYFPRIDGVRGNLPEWEETSGVPTTDSAWRWNMPVLRAAIRTDTLAAIVRGMRGKAELVLGSTVAAYDAAKWSGPDRSTDTAFVGGLGTSVARGDSDWAGGPSTLTQMISTLYTNPLLLGGRWDLEDGNMMPLGSRRGTPIDDVFQLAHYERSAAAAADGGAEATSFNPLMNTLAAIRYMGMQQKLLWNSSFRVLHVRPGGGADPVAGGAYSRRVASSAPKSLTELFVVRNRQTGEAVQWPQGPVDKDAKIYLHFESMHPTAAGGVVVDGVTLQEHPNHEFIGHLYPMISDSMGGNLTAGTGDNLNEDISDSAANVIVDKSFFTSRAVYTGLTGDTFMADPFDFECAKAAAEEEEDSTLMKVAKRDRNAENSGIEIDLLNELRIVRANAADYGLDQVGFGGKTWLDMMPTPAELTDPGDHEIVFVLYTGAAGQKMIDPSVPDSYNPPVAGCRVTATLEVNRPTERRSSDGDATGLHYGQTKRTSHVLGHA